MAVSAEPHRPEVLDSGGPERQRRRYRVTGVLFIVGAVLVNIPYSVLISTFEYPDILREDTSKILTEFADGGDSLIFTWLAFAWSGVPLLAAVLLLRRILDEDGHSLAGAATTIGVIGLVVQMVGLLRWVFVVPGLAEAYSAADATDATQASAVVTFDAVHQYGGVVLGEHLGQAFTIAWMVLVAAMMLRSRLFPQWLGWLGFVAAAIYSLGQLELIETVIEDFPFVGPAGLVGSLLWLGWMLIMGIRLLRVTPTPQEINRADH